MESSSSGSGTSTSGKRSEEPQNYWFPAPRANPQPNDPLGKLLRAVEKNDFGKTRRWADKLVGEGEKKKSLDEAVAAAAQDDPKSEGNGPLHVAARTTYVEMCKMLVTDYDCSRDATNNDDATPLFSAILGVGSQAVVEYLIESDDDTKKTDNHGRTPLHYAAGRGHYDIAAYLLSKGANVDAICQDEESPLHVAARSGHARIVELLLNEGANCNRLSRYGRTPLVESLSGSKLECFDKLIKAGAAVNTTPVTPLSVAAREGLDDCINRLLEKGAYPNQLDEDGKLPIEIAASKGWLKCVEILFHRTKTLKKFADLSIDQMVQNEKDACVLEERWATAEGDVAYWEDKNYDDALERYTLVNP